MAGSFLHDLIVGNLFVFLLLFARFGTALLIMPGIGDSFVSPTVRLFFALGFCFVMTPFMSSHLPAMPDGTLPFASLMIAEMITGFFIGTVMRILIAALDTVGSVISIQTGFSNALVFNPMTATQGSVVGALYSVMGVTLLMATDLHHYMLAAIVNSYSMFPANGGLPDTASMLEVIKRCVSASFLIGVQMSLPFIIVGIVMQYGFGLLSRLMPQVQIFFLTQPLQIGINLVMIAMCLSASILYWLNSYPQLLAKYLGQ